MSRPTEPHSTDENPEQWAAIAEWEKDRADKLSDALDDLINAADAAEDGLSAALRSAVKVQS